MTFLENVIFTLLAGAFALAFFVIFLGAMLLAVVFMMGGVKK